MADEHYTVILVPDARSAPRKIRVSRRLVRWAARSAAGLGPAVAPQTRRSAADVVERIDERGEQRPVTFRRTIEGHEERLR